MTISLPPRPTGFIDRVSEIDAIDEMLSSADIRLLTLTGAPGVGKTRLALEAAERVGDRFAQGVVVTDLSPLRDPTLMAPVLAQTIGLEDRGAAPGMERLRSYFEERSALLILDNFEHLLPAAPQVAELLVSCPEIKILVTSRSPLHLQWEQTLLVPPLRLPDPDHLPPIEALAAVPAVALFLQRARARQRETALTEQNARLVAELCVHLDGLPLAIELAAARMSVLPLPSIVDHLQDRLRLLQWEAPDVPDRHHSLQAAIAWSYDLLPEEEQRLFRHLGVFAGQVSLSAVRAVVGADDEEAAMEGLASLAEKSLISPGRQEGDNAGLCFGILETVHSFAREKLIEHDELQAAGRAHAQFFLDLAEHADAPLRTHGQRAWFLRLESEQDNVRIALRWLLNQAEYETALRLACALGYFWFARGHHAEGARWLEETLERAPHSDPSVRTKALLALGRILAMSGDQSRGMAVLEEARAHAHPERDAPAMVEALTYLGGCMLLAGQPDESRHVLHDALELGQRLGDHYHIGTAHFFLAGVAHVQGRYHDAALLYTEALTCYETAGNEQTASVTRAYLALTMGRLGDRAQAVALLNEVIELTRAFKDRWLLIVSVDATLILAGERLDADRRARLFGAVDPFRSAAGFSHSVWRRITAGSILDRVPDMIERDGAQAVYRAGRILSIDCTLEVTRSVLAELAEAPMGIETPRKDSGAPALLSKREWGVLRLVAAGCTNKEIAKELGISSSTVSYHLTSVFNKLGVDTRAHAVAVAARQWPSTDVARTI
jgi:predicted ATPase/ATP/maltotriose-dependent transcriptional regulator MalT